MDPFWLLNLQFTCTLVAFALIAIWWIVPALARLPKESALVPLLMVHVFRYAPMALFAPGQVATGLPASTVQTIAYGDLISAMVALAAAIALKLRSPAGLPLAWLFTLVGLADVAVALAAAIGAGVYEFALGFNWYIVTFYVPVLCVTHVMIVWLLLRKPTATVQG
jgi:hypothetical protein